MPSSGPADAWQVGEWVIDPAGDTIARGTETLKLEPRTMRLLICLAESAGEVVGLERLLAEVWTGVIVGPASVYQSISQLRKLLDDTGEQPTYIATVARKGYRLVAAVRRLPARPPPEGEAPALKTPVAVVPGRSRRLRTAAAIGLAALLALGLLWSPLKSILSPAAAAPSIVVLPFLDLTGSGSDQLFCDGLTEELSSWLAQLPQLRVVARTSAFVYRGKNEDVRRIGTELGVTHILEGSLRRSGDTARVTVQLIDARNGFHLWSDSYDQAMTNTIQMQEEVARSVARTLQVRLTEQTTARFAARHGANPEAYRIYLMARQAQQLRTREGNNQAIALYRQVLDADPGFALASVGLGYAYLNTGYFDGRPIREISDTVEPLLAGAIRAEPQLADAYAARGALRSDQARDADAQADLRLAIRLNPNEVRAYAELGRISLNGGRPREALESYSQAALLDPLDAMLHRQRCLALQDLARYADAGQACAHARFLAPDSPWGFDATAQLAWVQGRLDEALQWNARALEKAPADADLNNRRQNIFLALARGEPAKAVADQTRLNTGDDELGDIQRAQAAYLIGGAPALRAALAATRLNRSLQPSHLFSLAYLRLLVDDGAGAREAILRGISDPHGMADPNRDFHSWDSPQYARNGDSVRLLLASAEIAVGDQPSARGRLTSLLAMLNQMIAAGVNRYETLELRAETQALLGDPDSAMRDLTAAADMGWRRAWWAEREPFLASLRDRTDFRALMRRVYKVNASLQARLP